MIQVETTGTGPSMFAGAHHQTFENSEFRVAGRDMYHTPTVNVNITTPTSEYATNRARVALVRAPAAHTAPRFVQAQDGRGLWSQRIARFLRSRSGRGNTGHEEPLQNIAVANPHANGILATARNGRSTAGDSTGGDLAISSIEDFDNLCVDPEKLSNAEVYVRSLSSSKGLACWQPKPLRRFSGEEGVVPGDVGIFSAEDGFRKTFNLWDDIVSIRASGTATSDRRFQPPEQDIACHEDKMRDGETVVEGSVSSTVVSALGGQRRTSTFEFRCHSSHGAVLALTSPADLIEAVHQTELRDCIIRHAELLYRHAESIRRIGHDESLYIVTGCLKSDSWGLAAYKEPMVAPEDLLQLVHIGWDNALDQPNPIYAWTKRGTSEAKCGESSQTKRVKDQCLFLRGFKLAFSQSFRMKMRREVLQNSPGHPDNGFESSGSDTRDTGGGRDGNGGSTTMGRGGGTSGLFHERGSNVSGRTYEPADGLLIEEFPESHSQVYHPCDLINSFLLDNTGAEMALSHDDDYRFHSRKSSTWNDFIREILNSILKSQSIFVSGEVAFVDGEASARSRPEDVLCSVFFDFHRPSVLHSPDAWFDVEKLRFPIPVLWRPAPLPADLCVLPTLGPLHKEEEESLSVIFQRFLAFDLTVRRVRCINGTTMISYDEDHAVSALQGSGDTLCRISCSSTWFGYPPDPTLVVLSAIWHRMRTWDIVLERLAARLYFHHGALTKLTLDEAGRVTFSDDSIIRDLTTINGFHEDFTALLEDLVEDIPFSQEANSDHSEYAAERAVFIYAECEGLRSEASRLQSILSWQGRILQNLYDRAMGTPRHLATGYTAGNHTEGAYNTPHEVQLRQWYRAAGRKLMATPSYYNDNSVFFPYGPQVSTLPVRPMIEDLERSAKINLHRHSGCDYTLETVLRLAALCRSRGLRLAEAGMSKPAFVLLTEAYTVMSRWAPGHPDYFTRLTQEARRNLSLHSQDVCWDLQELSAKIMQGGGLSTSFTPPGSQQGTNQESSWGDAVVGTDGLHHAVSEAEVLALLSWPPGKAPVGVNTPLDTFSESEFPEFEGPSGYEIRADEQSNDPCLRLEKAVKRMFGSVAQVDYRFSLTRRNFPAPDPETPDYSATAFVKGLGVVGSSREIATGFGATTEAAIEEAAVQAYQALRALLAESII